LVRWQSLAEGFASKVHLPSLSAPTQRKSSLSDLGFAVNAAASDPVRRNFSGLDF
jgi:hypothetical protein